MRSSASIPGARRTSDALRSSRVRVTTAAEASARDHAAMLYGTPSFDLMLKAGTHAAAAILREYSDRLASGVAIYAGVGNNGGDAYIVAAQLARAGVITRVHSAGAPRTDDARRAAALADAAMRHGPPTGNERLVVDGVLGTGHRGPLRDDVLFACDDMRTLAASGATVVALDIPSGLDATTGAIAEGSVPAHSTLTFGTIKRGLLFARAHVGRVILLDIGLGHSALADDDAWTMADDATIAEMLPDAPWNAHKGRRGQLAIVGGANGMAGALVLSTRAALAAGCGLVRSWVEPAGVPVLQQSVPQAITHSWPVHADGAADAAAHSAWGSALAIGPGLGRSAESYALLERALRENVGVPVLLDADALTLLAMRASSGDVPSRDLSSRDLSSRDLSTGDLSTGDASAPDSSRRDAASALRTSCESATAVVCTPHPREFSRLVGAPLADDWQARAGQLQDFADRANAIVLLKGTPTLIATPEATSLHVVARGNPVLATGGSGDILTGLIGALLAQGIPATSAVLLGATAHGIAAELAAQDHGTIRGVTLDHVLAALPRAWRAMAQPASFPPGVIAELPAPGPLREQTS